MKNTAHTSVSGDRRLASIDMISYLQVSKLAEGLATSSKAAHERLDLIVDALMGLQVAKLSKGLVAARVRALVGTLSGMLALVSLQVARGRTM